MKFLQMGEWLGLIFVILFTLTQVIIPSMKGRPLFPWFRKSQKKLEQEAAEAAQKKAEEDIREGIKDIKSKAKATSFQRQRQRERKWGDKTQGK